MKIIDLINKINNDEKVPDKVKFKNIIFEYSKKQKDYIHEIDAWCSETLLFKVMNTHFISDLLRAEVDVVEENEEIDIQGIKPFIIPQIAKSDEEDMWADRIIINKLIKSVKKLDNKLNKESEK